MQYKDYDSMMASEPWLKYQTYDEDFNMVWKDNVPQNIKDKYERWLEQDHFGLLDNLQ